jgi:hypothetical protein
MYLKCYCTSLATHNSSSFIWNNGQCGQDGSTFVYGGSCAQLSRTTDRLSSSRFFRRFPEFLRIDIEMVTEKSKDTSFHTL